MTRRALLERLHDNDKRIKSLNGLHLTNECKNTSFLIRDICRALNVKAEVVNQTNSAKSIEEQMAAVTFNSASKATEKSQLKDLISKISKKHGVDEKLVNAVIKQESGYNTKAKSSAGAQGLMQLMPATAKSLGVTDPYNPVQNVDGGVRYLKSMMEKYNGNVVLALAAYNAGPGNVDKYDGVPPFKETQNYVKNVLYNYL